MLTPSLVSRSIHFSVATSDSFGRLRTRFLVVRLVLAALLCATSVVAQTKTATTTTLALTSGGAPVTSVTAGTVVTLTASVKAGSTAVNPGQVDFCDATATYCTDVHVVGTAQLTSAGTAVFKFRPGPGTHSYRSEFLGTNTYAPTASATSSLTVTGASPPFAGTSTLTETGNWGNYYLTGSITEVGHSTPLTGTVSFLDTSSAGAVLGSAPLGTSTLASTWINSQTPSAGYEPIVIAVGDFNGDGIPDLLVPDYKTSSVFPLLGNGDGTFTAGAMSPVKSVGGAIAVGDFNGDGILDLAITSGDNPGSMSILLGNGDGTFKAVSTMPSTVEYPNSVTVADFNGDGNLDLAVSSNNSTTGVVSILLGNGDGTFTSTQVNVPATACVSGVASADFNGDGNQDLVLTSACVYDQGNSVTVITGNGDGTFTTWATPQTGHDAGAVTVGDFNGDGRPDIAVVNSDGSATVTVLLNKGDGTFNIADLGPSLPQRGPAMIASGDFNGNSTVDLAVPDINTDTVEIYEGKGDGTFLLSALQPATGRLVNSIVAADFNGDGRADIATDNIVDSTVTVLLSELTETASTAAIEVAPGSTGPHLVEASYSGDSNYDASVSATAVLWGQPPVTTTALMITSGGKAATTVPPDTAVTLTATVLAGSSPLTRGQVNFCDATAKTCTDIHLVGSAQLTTSGTATFTYIPGPGQYSYKAVLQENAYGLSSASPEVALTVNQPAHTTVPTSTGLVLSGSIGNYTLTATVVETGSTQPLTGNVSFLDTSYSNTVLASSALGSSTPGLAWAASSIPFVNIGTIMIASGDFNGDGIPDIAAVSTNAGTVTIFLGNGDGTFKTIAGPTLSGYTTAVVAGDFNGDGKTDLAVSWVVSGDTYFEPGNLAIFLGKGDGTFTAVASSPAVGDNASVFAAVDFNGDGKLDLLVNEAANNESTNTRILLGNGDGTFAEAPATGLFSTVAVADLNGDGFPDLVIGSNPSLAISAATVVLGNGNGTFRPIGTSLSTGSAEPPSAATVADFNGDGIPDIALEGSSNSAVVIYLGVGDGTFTQANPSSPALPLIIEAGSMVAADINGDGKVDLIVTNENPGTTGPTNPDVTFLLGNGDGTFTAIADDTQLTSAYAVITSDLTGNGRPDLIVGTVQGLSVLMNQPTQTATATASGVSPTGPAPHQVAASYPGDSNYNSSTSAPVSLDVRAATPVFSLAPGTYTSLQKLTLTDTTPGATIYYMSYYGGQQGSTWTQYTGPITLGAQGTVNFQAYANETGYEQSFIGTATYTLSLPPEPAPAISLPSGSYAGPQTVTISDSMAGATIYYTLNGSVPTSASTLYSGPITISSSEALVAAAITPGYAPSTSVSAQYLIGNSLTPFIYTVAGSGIAGYSGDGGPAVSADLNYPYGTVFDNAGNLYIADGVNCVIRRVAANTGIISTIAGTGVPGYSGDNGPASNAQFNGPFGLAIDGSGNLYVSEGNNVVRKIDIASGIITTYAGNYAAGTNGPLGDGGPATSANLGGPGGLAFDTAGNLYIASSASRIRQVAVATGIITTVAGNGVYGYTGDGGPAINATLTDPAGLALDSAGNIYIADTNNEVIREVNAATGIISTIVGDGTPAYGGDGGPALNAEMYAPIAVTLDSARNIYIADWLNNVVRKVTAATGVITTFAGSYAGLETCNAVGGDGGPATSAQLCFPYGLSVDSKGNLYVSALSQVREITVSMLPPAEATATPSFSVTPGTYSSPQTVTITDATPGAAIHITMDGTEPTVHSPEYVGTINVTGNVTIQALAIAPGYSASSAGTAAYVITSVPAAVISTAAGNGTNGFSSSGGQATSSEIGPVQGVAVDSTGNLYIADSGNHVVWMVTAKTGTITVVAGNGTSGYTGDGAAAIDAELEAPVAVAVDSGGNLYIADQSANVIRKVTASTAVISTFAGTGQAYGNSGDGDGGPATSALLAAPMSLAFDSGGNLYIADTGHFVVRKVTASTGIISLVAGNYTYGSGSDGGSAISTSLRWPNSIVLDVAGNLYIADQDAARVRKVVATTGIITTVVGNGASGNSGDGSLATKAEITPNGVALDAAGNLYISTSTATGTLYQSTSTSAVHEVNAATGIINLVVGTGFSGYSGDGGSATVAEISYPQGITFDSDGNMYIADSGNYRVRKVTPTGGIATPVFNPPGGTYSGSQAVTITDSSQDVTIYYTTDGSTPTSASTVYDGAVEVSASEMLQSIALGTGYGQSEVAKAAYIINQPATPTIKWVSPEAITYGTLLSTAQLNATASVPGTFAYSPGPGALLGAGAHTLSVTFTPSDSNDYTNTSATVQLTVNQATPTLSWSTPAAITFGTALGAAQLDATASVPGAFAYTPPAGTIPAIGTNTLSVTFTPTDVVDYTTATDTVTIVVNVPVPAISTLSPIIATAGAASFTLTVNGSGFTSSSQINWGSTPLSTQYVSGAQLTAQVPASAVASAGTATVTVQNPAPGGISNALQFEIDSAGSTTPPSFSPTTATVTPGTSASYPVTLPSSATDISIKCLNLPNGATCTYSASSSAVIITTASTTPKGTYQVVVVFTETIPDSAGAMVFLPLLLLPLLLSRKQWKTRGFWFAVCLVLLVSGAAATGCGGGSSKSNPPPVTHQVTSSGVVTLIVQ